MEPEQLRWYINHFGLIFAPWLAAGLGVLAISLTPIGRAIVDRLRAGGRARALQTETEIAGLRRQIEELHERLDYTERALPPR